MLNRPATVAELPAFVQMMQAAASEQAVAGPLRRLLSLPAPQRRNALEAWVRELLARGAPQDFVAAIACLTDDALAEQVSAVLGP